MRMAVVACTLLLTTQLASAESEPERLYYEGQRAYDAKQYGAAIDAWQQSFARSKLPGLLFNLGQAYRLRARTGDCTQAVDTYRRFITLDPASTKRAEAERFLAELAPCADAERAPILREPAPSGKRPLRLASYASLGVGLASVAVGAYYGNRASSLGDQVTAACAETCSLADVAALDAEGRRAARLQYVLYGVGAVGLVTSGALYWLSRSERAPRVAVVPRGDGAMVSWHRRW